MLDKKEKLEIPTNFEISMIVSEDGPKGNKHPVLAVKPITGDFHKDLLLNAFATVLFIQAVSQQTGEDTKKLTDEFIELLTESQKHDIHVTKTETRQSINLNDLK